MSYNFECHGIHNQEVKYAIDQRELITIFEDLLQQAIAQLEKNVSQIKIEYNVPLDWTSRSFLKKVFENMPSIFRQTYRILNDYTFNNFKMTTQSLTCDVRRRFVPAITPIVEPKQTGNAIGPAIIIDAVTTTSTVVKSCTDISNLILEKINKMFWKNCNETTVNARIIFIGKISDEMIKSLRAELIDTNLKTRVPALDTFNIQFSISSVELVMRASRKIQVRTS